MVCTNDDLICTGFDLNYTMWAEYSTHGNTPRYHRIHAIAHEIWKLILAEDRSGEVGPNQPGALEEGKRQERELLAKAREFIPPEIWGRMPNTQELLA